MLVCENEGPDTIAPTCFLTTRASKWAKMGCLPPGKMAVFPLVFFQSQPKEVQQKEPYQRICVCQLRDAPRHRWSRSLSAGPGAKS